MLHVRQPTRIHREDRMPIAEFTLGDALLTVVEIFLLSSTSGS